MKFRDKIVLVSGGGTGIGKAVAKAFGKEGATIYLIGRRLEPLQETCDEIIKSGGKAERIQADVRVVDELKAAVSRVEKESQGLDILVNAASIFRLGNVHETSLEDFEDLFDTNVKGLWLLSKASIPLMKMREGALILHISSLAGLKTERGMGIFESSKAAVNTLTKVMAKELSGLKIRVNAIAPGPFRTNLLESSPFGEEDIFANKEGNGVDKPPFGKRGNFEEVARLALYLASSESDFVNGSIIPIDGTLGY